MQASITSYFCGRGKRAAPGARASKHSRPATEPVVPTASPAAEAPTTAPGVHPRRVVERKAQISDDKVGAGGGAIEHGKWRQLPSQEGKREAPVRRRSPNVEKMPNLLFYRNKVGLGLRTRPTIDDILAKWFGRYRVLESKHDFIQWLFPTMTRSCFNNSSFALTRTEAAEMRRDVDVGRRLMMSYRLMLDFYGLQLQDECTGALQRSPCFRERMQAAIVRSSHNHLRLARIMSSLSVLGFRPHALELLHRLRREVQRGALRSLQRGRALAMWCTYEDADTPGFAQYCMATRAELEDTSAYLVALRMEKSRKSTQPATDGKEDEAES